MPRRVSTILAIAALLTAEAGLPARLDAQCLPGMCAFTESGKKGRYLDTDVDPEKLAKEDATIASGRSAGKLFAAESLNRGELFGAGLSMRETEASIVELMNRLRPHWKYRQPPSLKVRIVGIHSFVPQAFADGTIVIPLGVLYQAKSDDQVAWLLAHEFSHLALGHFAREVRRKKRNQSVTTAFNLMRTGVEGTQVRLQQNAQGLRVYEVQDPAAQEASLSLFRRSRELQRVLSLLGGFHSRSQEDQADVLGLDLALAAGYSEEGASTSFDILARDDETTAAMVKRISGQIGGIAQRAGGQALQQAKDGGSLEPIGQSFLRSVGKNALQIVGEAMFKAYGKAHRPALKRKEGVVRYFGRAYKEPPIVDSSTAWLDKVRATAEYRDAFAAVTAVEKARDKINQGLVAEAAVDIQAALATRYRDTPLVANVNALILDRAGRKREADRVYSLAAKLPSDLPKTTVRRAERSGRGARRGKAPIIVPPIPVILSDDPYLEQTLAGFGEHVALLVGMADYAKALIVIAEGKRRFKDDTSFLPQLVAIYFRTNQLELMAASYGRCLQSDNPDLLQRCDLAFYKLDVQQKLAELAPADRAKLDFETAVKRDKVARTGFWSQLFDSAAPKDDDEDTTN